MLLDINRQKYPILISLHKSGSTWVNSFIHKRYRHIGLTPQFVEQFGGFKKQGKSLQEQTVLLEQAKQLELCGAFAVVLEVIPDDLASSITKAITIPTIGIGAFVKPQTTII